MNEGFWRNQWKRLVVCTLLLLPIIVFLFYRSELSPLLSYTLLFVGTLCAFLALSIFQTGVNWLLIPTHIVQQQLQQSVSGDADTLAAVPRTLDEVLRLDPKEFEILSAAVVIGMGEGHYFLKHCGQRGDEGIDAKLLNHYRLPVVVQSKLYGYENHIEPTQVRDFMGAIIHEKAVYGFFVTTSTFTSAAYRWIAEMGGRIRTIDGRQLEMLLQNRWREIALAYCDILNNMAGK